MMVAARNRWIVTSVIMITLVASSSTLPAAERLPWKVYENGFVKALSNAQQSVALEILRELETFRLVAKTVFPVSIPEGSLKTLLVIFGGELEFREYAANRHIAGFALHTGRLGIIVMPASHRYIEAKHVVRHEFVHALNVYHDANLPKWYREGLAELLASIEISGEEFIVGAPPEWRGGYVPRLLSFKKLIHEDFKFGVRTLATEGTDVYLQSWLLTHYAVLGADDDFKKRFKDYLRAYNDGMRSEDAFSKMMNVKAGSLWTKHLKKYVRALPTFSGRFDPSAGDTGFSVSPAEEKEINAILEFLIENKATQLEK